MPIVHEDRWNDLIGADQSPYIKAVTPAGERKCFAHGIVYRPRKQLTTQLLMGDFVTQWAMICTDCLMLTQPPSTSGKFKHHRTIPFRWMRCHVMMDQISADGRPVKKDPKRKTAPSLLEWQTHSLPGIAVESVVALEEPLSATVAFQGMICFESTEERRLFLNTLRRAIHAWVYPSDGSQGRQKGPHESLKDASGRRRTRDPMLGATFLPNPVYKRLLVGHEKVGGTVYHAAMHDDLEGLRMMLLHREDPDQPDEWDNTGLHIAAFTGSLRTLSLLLRLDIILDPLNYANETPLVMAIRAGSPKAVRLLLQAGANPYILDYGGRSVPQLAARIPNETAAFLILGHLLRFPPGIDSRTSKRVYVSIAAGGDEKDSTRGQRRGFQGLPDVSALHVFVVERHLEAAERLLRAGADPNVTTNDRAKQTPLHWAILKGDRKMTELLLRFGAHPNKREGTSSGGGPGQIPSELVKHKAIALLLASFGAIGWDRSRLADRESDHAADRGGEPESWESGSEDDSPSSGRRGSTGSDEVGKPELLVKRHYNEIIRLKDEYTRLKWPSMAEEGLREKLHFWGRPNAGPRAGDVEEDPERTPGASLVASSCAICEQLFMNIPREVCGRCGIELCPKCCSKRAKIPGSLAPGAVADDGQPKIPKSPMAGVRRFSLWQGGAAAPSSPSPMSPTAMPPSPSAGSPAAEQLAERRKSRFSLSLRRAPTSSFSPQKRVTMAEASPTRRDFAEARENAEQEMRKAMVEALATKDKGSFAASEKGGAEETWCKVCDGCFNFLRHFDVDLSGAQAQERPRRSSSTNVDDFDVALIEAVKLWRAQEQPEVAGRRSIVDYMTPDQLDLHQHHVTVSRQRDSVVNVPSPVSQADALTTKSAPPLISTPPPEPVVPDQAVKNAVALPLRAQSERSPSPTSSPLPSTSKSIFGALWSTAVSATSKAFLSSSAAAEQPSPPAALPSDTEQLPPPVQVVRLPPRATTSDSEAEVERGCRTSTGSEPTEKESPVSSCGHEGGEGERVAKGRGSVRAMSDDESDRRSSIVSHTSHQSVDYMAAFDRGVKRGSVQSRFAQMFDQQYLGGHQRPTDTTAQHIDEESTPDSSLEDLPSPSQDFPRRQSDVRRASQWSEIDLHRSPEAKTVARPSVGFGSASPTSPQRAAGQQKKEEPQEEVGEQPRRGSRWNMALQKAKEDRERRGSRWNNLLQQAKQQAKEEQERQGKSIV